MTEKQDLISRLKLVAQSVHGFELDTVNEAVEVLERLELRDYNERVKAGSPPTASAKNSHEEHEFAQMMLRDHRAMVMGYVSRKGQLRYFYSGRLWDRIQIIGTVQVLQIAALAKILTKPENPPSPDALNTLYQQFMAYAAMITTYTPVPSVEDEGDYIDADTGKHLWE